VTDEAFRDRLITFITTIASECLPPVPVEDEENVSLESQVFLPFPDPDAVDFEDVAASQISDIVRSRQMHSRHHTPTCFKYDPTQCRLRFPRQLFDSSIMDPETHVIHVKRDDAWLNGYNRWLSLALRANHDVQYLHTQDHGMAIMYYILKYISKSEQSLYSKLSIAASVRAAQVSTSSANTITGKKMITQIYNKIQSHREVGLPEAISHLLEVPDHYTEGKFVPISTTQLFYHFQALNHLGLQNTAADHADDADESQDLDGEIVVEDRTYRFVSFFDDYQCRGPALAEYCLYDYVALYYKAKSKHGLPFTPEHPQHRNYSQVQRAEDGFVIPNVLGCLTYLTPTTKDQQEKEKYFCILTALFTPWSKDTVRKSDDTTWEEYFNRQASAMCDRVSRHIGNICLLSKSKEESRFDRLQRASIHSAAPFMREESIADESDGDEDSARAPNFQPPSSMSEEDMIAHAIAIREGQNSADFYTLEAIDACFNHDYFGLDMLEPLPQSDTSVNPQYLSMHSRVVKQAMQRFDKCPAATAPPSHTISHMNIEPSVTITHESFRSSVDAIINRYSLNDEQTLALRIVTDHAYEWTPLDGSHQLLMGVFGEGGTGKSTLIEAIEAWFSSQGRDEELMLTATTGSAASHISAVTLHSATGIMIEDCDSPKSRTAANNDRRIAEWAGRRYLSVDEISMLDRSTMVKLDKQLKIITGNSSVYFGGMNIIFFGDFLQFPAVSHMDLYVAQPKLHPFGHDLWRSLNAVVILEKQMRQLDDPCWAALLHRLRLRQPVTDDIDLLHSRVGAPLPPSATTNCPTITRRHTVRKAINNLKLVQASEQSGVPITYCVAGIFKPKKMHQREIYEISYN